MGKVPTSCSRGHEIYSRLGDISQCLGIVYIYLPSDVSPWRVETENTHHEDEEGPFEPVVEDAGEGIGEEDDVDEAVEGEPGEEVSAAPRLEPAEGKQIHAGGQGGQNGDGETWKEKRQIIIN